jgi:hypothetical protein
MTQRVLATALVIVAALYAPSVWAASSKVLYTAPAQSNYPTLQTLYCDILNVSNEPMDITVEILDYSGTVVATSGALAINPTAGTAFPDTTGAGAYCRFSISGSTRKVRAMAIYDNGAAYTTSVPAY